MYSKNIFLTLEKTKISFVFRAILVFLHWYFVLLTDSWGCFDIFHVFFSNFLFRNIVACVPNMPASGWSPSHSGDATRWPNLDICRFTEYAIISPSTWCSACRSMVVESSQLVIYFVLFFLFSLDS